MANEGDLTVRTEDVEEPVGRGEFLTFPVWTNRPVPQGATLTVDYRVFPLKDLVAGLDFCVISSGVEPDADFRCRDLGLGYGPISGEVTIDAGQDSAMIHVWVDRQAVIEDRREIWVDLFGVTGVEGARITKQFACGRVTEKVTADTEDTDDPPLPEVNIIGSHSVEEGEAVRFTLTASPAPTSILSVDLTVVANGDFASSGKYRLTIPSSGTTTLELPTRNDREDEPDGSVTATLESGQGYTVGSQSAATVFVTDNDDPPRAQLQDGSDNAGGSKSSATVVVADDDDDVQQQQQDPVVTITGGSGINEGAAATFTITASPAPASPITVKVGVSEKGDFGAVGPATVTVSGATTTYTITTTDDSTDEADGSVTVTLQGGSGYTVGSKSSATVAVVDDDAPAAGNRDTLTVSVAGPEDSAGPGEFLEFTVTAGETAQQDVTVTYSVWGGDLVRGFDYCIISSGAEPKAGFRCFDLPPEHSDRGGEVTIAKGEDTATIYIWIDREAEITGEQEIIVTLSAVEGAQEITEDLASGQVAE